MAHYQAQPTIFKHGAVWLRADFHLHTRADAEFVYAGDPSYFASKYVEQLEREQIHIAVITNHNKFDLTEFKELRKAAERKEIYLLPGIELSITGGNKGLHILVVFDDSWIYNPENKNYIEDFIKVAFTGKSGYDRTPYDQNSRLTFNQVCSELDHFDRDYFIVMAHVDDSSGLFCELSARGLSDLIGSEDFKKRVLALQKSRTRDNRKHSPDLALVEGTDSAHAGIEGIGQSNMVGSVMQKTYLKLGAFNFTALKYALRCHKQRVNTAPPTRQGLFVKKLTINPDTESEISIPFNAGLNTLIGVRGGGKSSVLEAVRYALGVSLPDDVHRREDREYKEKIVRRLLRNGGVRLELADSTGQTAFFVERMDGEQAEVFDSGRNPIPAKRPQDLFEVAYFGQKDLEKAGENFDGRFIENKLLQRDLEKLKAQTQQAIQDVRETWSSLNKLQGELAELDDVNAEIKRLQNLQVVYQTHNLQNRLELITLYDTEEDFLRSAQELLHQMCTEIGGHLDNNIEELQQWLLREPKVEAQIFSENIFPAILKILDTWRYWHQQVRFSDTGSNELLRQFVESVHLFELQRQTKRAEIESVKQQIDDPNIDVEIFRELERHLRINKQKQQVLQKKEKEHKTLREKLNLQTDYLVECWKNEHNVVSRAIDEFNNTSSSIHLTVNFMGDSAAFAVKLKEWAKGSNLRDNHYAQLVEHYQSGIVLYRDIDKDDSALYNILKGGFLLPKFQESMQNSELDLLTWRTPDRYEFIYNGKPLADHSLGQRATALAAFILAHQDKDLFLIDQPEDDLDNQTVARELIKQVVSTKVNTQYIFATHNPNIVVLGDSDQVIECRFPNDQLDLGESGSIDEKKVQETVVNIMEGGKEAMKTRAMFYQIANSWKH